MINYGGSGRRKPVCVRWSCLSLHSPWSVTSTPRSLWFFCCTYILPYFSNHLQTILIFIRRRNKKVQNYITSRTWTHRKKKQKTTNISNFHNKHQAVQFWSHLSYFSYRKPPPTNLIFSFKLFHGGERGGGIVGFVVCEGSRGISALEVLTIAAVITDDNR